MIIEKTKSVVGTAALVLILGLAFHPRPALASGIPVVDGGHIVAQITQFTETMTRYQAQVAEWQNLLSKNPLSRLREAASLRPKLGAQLQIRGDDFGSQRCSADGSSPLAAIGNLFQVSFNPEGNLRDEQKKLCMLEVALINRRWNENVLMIRQMELLEEQLSVVADAQSSGMTQGEIDTHFANLKTAQADYEVNRDKGVARIKTYDGMISSVSSMQSMVAQQLLAGQKPSGFVESAVNTLVQGAVLEAALSVGAGSACSDRLGQRGCQ